MRFWRRWRKFGAAMGKRAVIDKDIERIVRPIVEGQIRGFLKEHPKLVLAVDWYKPRTDKAKTLTNSLAKRIVRDLACGITSARLEDALVARRTAAQPISTVALATAAKPSWLAESLAKIGRTLCFTWHP